MMKSCRWLLFGLLLLVGSVVHAEGGCPLGYYPYPMGNAQGQPGPQGCAPIPGYNNNQQQAQPQPLPPHWKDRWGAIATYEPNGSLGTASNMPSQSSAEQIALKDCQSKHGATCQIQISYRNQCAAMVVGGKIFNVNPGATVEEAEQKGMTTCSAAASDCHVYYSACSLPERIR